MEISGKHFGKDDSLALNLGMQPIVPLVPYQVPGAHSPVPLDPVANTFRHNFSPLVLSFSVFHLCFILG
jgi:hypothetical protein